MCLASSHLDGETETSDLDESWFQLLETLPLPNVRMTTSTLLEVECSHVSHTYNIVMEIKWICPTAPIKPISGFGGFPSINCL
ncbi:hypothetical protein RchiOBHm_Chr4g0431191 [Rosa chinensis]|uniref:Uncharacterized protein n=1 Tax=Rosa chinensis TaxID=74649 RepID=A0A2P6R0T0_ROSCH|nr:hypothetical protein RchiOBHm_Chr4g0431191 [Rosa chinensis]